MTKFNSHQKMLMAFDSFIGNTLETAKAMAEKICDHLWKNEDGHNGAIITHKIKDAEWIINVVRWGDLFTVNIDTADYTGTGKSVMQVHEEGKGKDKCVVRLARKLTMILPAVKRLNEARLQFVSIEQLPTFKQLAFKTTDEIFKAVRDELE